MQIWIENDDVLNQILDKLGTNKVSSYKVKQVGESIIATIEVATTDELDPMKFNSLIREFPTHLLSIERADE